MPEPYRYLYQHRVRYRECDPMGVVYHTHYLDYFEAARTEALRDLGLPYKSLEDRGLVMPVVEAALQYRRSASYDDLLVIDTQIAEVPRVRVPITYAVRRDGDPEILVTGRVTLCFVDRARSRPVAAPDDVRTLFAEALGMAESA